MFNTTRIRALWLVLFGRTTLCGLDMGFWVSLGVEVAVMIMLNVILWHKGKQ